MSKLFPYVSYPTLGQKGSRDRHHANQVPFWSTQIPFWCQKKGADILGHILAPQGGRRQAPLSYKKGRPFLPKSIFLALRATHGGTITLIDYDSHDSNICA